MGVEMTVNKWESLKVICTCPRVVEVYGHWTEKKVSFLSFWSEIQCLSRSCADKAEAAANGGRNNANRQKFPDIPVESITSYSEKRASRNKYAKNFTGVKSSMCTHAHSLSGWPSGELQEVSPVRVSRCSPLMAPPFSWKWRTESTHTKLPAGQHPSNSNLLPLINTTEETWRRGFAVYLCWNLFLTSFILLLSERPATADRIGPGTWICAHPHQSLSHQVPVDQTFPVFLPVARIHQTRLTSRAESLKCINGNR